MSGMDMPVALRQRKGRGAASNATGRFEAEQRVAFDDGWGLADAEPAPLATTLGVDSTRTIIARNDSPDIGFDRSINPYRGCEHGCIYCYARPSHAYLGLSPGLDFESRLFYKPQAAKLLAAELRKKGYACRPIALGSNTDPYQPAERKLGITRAILEVLRDFRHPVTIVTKSALIQRDLDILGEMARDRLAMAAISVTTLDRRLARVMEPRAAAPERRLETIAALAAAGVPARVMSAPMIPALNDSEMEQILERARAAGATSAAYTLLRLPLELKDLFKEWLETHFPAKQPTCFRSSPRPMAAGFMIQPGSREKPEPAPMQMSCGCGSSAPAAGSASTNARRARSTSAASGRHRSGATSSRCFKAHSPSEPDARYF